MNPQGTKLDIGWLGESWKILQSRMGEYIGMVVVATLLTGVIYFIVYIPFNIIINIVAQQSIGMAFVLLGMQQLVIYLAMGIGYIFYSGIIIFTLKHLRGERAQFEDLFIAFKNPAPYIIGGLLYGLATSIGVLACCIGTYAVSGVLMFMFPLMYDRKLSAVDAMKESINLLKDQWPMAMAYAFVAGLVGGLGVIACFVGVFVTLPLAFIMPALAYHKIVGGSTEPFLSPSQYPRNPGDEANMPAAPSAWPTEAPASTVDPVPPATPSEPQPPVEGWGDTMADNSPQPPAPDSSATVGEADVVIEDPKPEDHRPS